MRGTVARVGWNELLGCPLKESFNQLDFICAEILLLLLLLVILLGRVPFTFSK
jgi:hypothetical protein